MRSVSHPAKDVSVDADQSCKTLLLARPVASGTVIETIAHGPNAEIGIMRDQWNCGWSKRLRDSERAEQCDDSQNVDQKEVTAHRVLFFGGYAARKRPPFAE
jgi:hypothetical protein